MKNKPATNIISAVSAIILSAFCALGVNAQNTVIKGFVDATTTYDKKLSFGFGEQDLFITSQLNDRFSFLGESVFKFSPLSPTEFNVSIERVVIKYNFSGNHNLIIGKVHTPLNYWNDTYHHGRVFFPTIERPLLFAREIIPLHTTGIDLQGHDLGSLKFGYDLMVGNGLGSAPVSDNDQYKSYTLAVHIKPVDKMRIGLSYYNDIASKGSEVEGKTMTWQVNQQLLSGSFAYFGKKVEVLAEGTLAIDHTDTTGNKNTLASYLYLGYRATSKLVPYIRLDEVHYQQGELLFDKDNMSAIVAGLRYEINYLTVVKLEYQHTQQESATDNNKVTAQIAIGF